MRRRDVATLAGARLVDHQALLERGVVEDGELRERQDRRPVAEQLRARAVDRRLRVGRVHGAAAGLHARGAAVRVATPPVEVLDGRARRRHPNARGKATRVVLDVGAEELGHLEREQVVEVDVVALVDRIREVPVAQGEGVHREEFVVEDAGALHPEEAVLARLVRRPHVEAGARAQPEVRSSRVRIVADATVDVRRGVERVGADVRQRDDLGEPVHRVDTRAVLVVDAERTALRPELRLVEVAEVEVLVDLRRVLDRAPRGPALRAAASVVAVVRAGVALFPGATVVVDRLLEGLARVEAVAPRDVVSALVAAEQVLDREDRRRARRRVVLEVLVEGRADAVAVAATGVTRLRHGRVAGVLDALLGEGIRGGHATGAGGTVRVHRAAIAAAVGLEERAARRVGVDEAIEAVDRAGGLRVRGVGLLDAEVVPHCRGDVVAADAGHIRQVTVVVHDRAGHRVADAASAAGLAGRAQVARVVVQLLAVQLTVAVAAVLEEVVVAVVRQRQIARDVEVAVVVVVAVVGAGEVVPETDRVAHLVIHDRAQEGLLHTDGGFLVAGRGVADRPERVRPVLPVGRVVEGSLRVETRADVAARLEVHAEPVTVRRAEHVAPERRGDGHHARLSRDGVLRETRHARVEVLQTDARVDGLEADARREATLDVGPLEVAHAIRVDEGAALHAVKLLDARGDRGEAVEQGAVQVEGHRRARRVGIRVAVAARVGERRRQDVVADTAVEAAQVLAREVRILGGLAAEHREEVRRRRRDRLERLARHVRVRDDQLARARVHHRQRDAAELQRAVLDVVEELVANVAEVLTGLRRVGVARVCLEQEQTLGASEVVVERVRAVVLVRRRSRDIRRADDVTVVRADDAGGGGRGRILERVVLVVALAVGIDLGRLHRAIGALPAVLGGVHHLRIDAGGRSLDRRGADGATMTAHERLVPVTDDLERGARQVAREAGAQVIDGGANPAGRDRRRAAAHRAITLRTDARRTRRGIPEAVIALPVGRAGRIRKRVRIEVVAGAVEGEEVRLAVVAREAAFTDVRCAASATGAAVGVRGAVVGHDAAVLPATHVGALVGAEETEAIELLVRLGVGGVLVVRRDAEERRADRDGRRRAEPAVVETVRAGRPDLLVYEGHVVNGVAEVSGPLVAEAVGSVVLHADELRLVALREARSAIAHLAVRAGLEVEGHRLGLEDGVELRDVRAVVGVERADQVLRPVDAHELTLVPLAIRGVLRDDVGRLARDGVVLTADIEVALHRERCERLPTEVWRATVVVAAVDQLVRAIGVEEVLVEHPADAGDVERLALVHAEVDHRHIAAERGKPAGAEDGRLVRLHVDDGRGVPPLTVENRLVDDVRLDAVHVGLRDCTARERERECCEQGECPLGSEAHGLAFLARHVRAPQNDR